MGTLLNQRLTPRMLAAEEDVWRFVDYLRAFEVLDKAQDGFFIHWLHHLLPAALPYRGQQQTL